MPIFKYRIVLFNPKLNEKAILDGTYTKPEALSEVDNLRKQGLPAFYEKL